MLIISILISVFFFNGCVSTENSASSQLARTSEDISRDSFWITMPASETLTIIGVSGPQSRERYIAEVAREHAARNVSLFHRIEASFVNMHRTGTSIFDYDNIFEQTIIFDENLEPFMERLDFDPDKDIIRIGNTTFIRFTYPAVFPGTINFYSRRNPNGSPVWSTNPPVIDGYLVGVGHARRQIRTRDTFIRSSESAIAALVSQVSTIITSREVDVNSITSIVSTHESRGVLTSFLVLDIWFDPATQDVWTLAVAISGN